MNESRPLATLEIIEVGDDLAEDHDGDASSETITAPRPRVTLR
jgi:hypothetical protein